ncbi:MAG: short-chain dehydrogenase [Actinomycetia bacterium]|nr:short-chain dehydrogenase [Actinomycetes bacterium]
MQTAVVTGANSGIGLETARGLARAGFHVVLLCRNQGRAEAAKADIDASVDGASTDIVLADLGQQADVRRAAAELEARLERLDVLVDNAGLTVRSRERTAEGHDQMLAVNHLGPFLLTNLLLPLLHRSAPSRIVVVASEAHKFRKLKVDDLEAERRGYGVLGLPRYGETKLMNILFVRELAKRLEGTGVTVNAVHPGAVNTALGAPPAFLSGIAGRFMKTPEQGAFTSLVVATDPDLAGVNGGYFIDGKRAEKKLNAQARDDVLAAELWKRSEDLVGMSNAS